MTPQRTQSNEQENEGSRIRQVVLSRSLCCPARSVVPLASGPLLRRRLPSSLVPRSSVQAAPRPFGSRALHPDQIEAVNQAFAPSPADYSRAVRIIKAYEHATTVQARGAVMLGDEMIDEASRKMIEVIVARGNAAGYAEIPKATE
jgi:citrate lyase subunit beta / citryl-CoA lyase